MLIRVFSSIRQKPKHVRDQYAFWIAAVVTVLVAVSWLVDLPGKLNPEQAPAESEPVFSSFFNEAGSRLSDVTESFSGLRTSTESADEQIASTSTLDVSASSTDTMQATTSMVAPVVQREVRIATTTMTASTTSQ